MHASSFEKMKDFRDRHLAGRESEALEIYDLGAQDILGSYRPLFADTAWNYRGVDLEAGPNVDIVLSEPYHWKEIPSESCDVLISGQTFEHIEYFWITILEIWRVLKPGGIVCIIAPSAGNQHRFPVDCWRFYPDGFTALCKYVGLQPKQIYTQWQPKGTYPDSSDSWKDSVLIAEKPAMPPLLKFKHNLKMALRRRLSAPPAA
ncbi:MAG: methyltransferase domain-containing protein [Halieaceae bacterium]|jgi:SAM-dependent methyltransferase|nr:methyltransferase domain-containing protein [Halieaceae bacterium]